MTHDQILNAIGIALFAVFCIILVVLYGLNFYRAIKDLNAGNIRLLTLARFAGIFFPVLGIVLGFVTA